MLFRKWGCLVGPENSIFRKLKSVDPKNVPLTTEMLLHFHFTFKGFPENERERERARAWGEDPPGSRAPASVRDRDRRRDRAVDRDLVKKARSRSGAIAISDRYVPWSRSRIAIAPWAPWSRSRRGRRTENISGINDFFFFLGCGLWLVFSDLRFPSSFPNTRKYFPENFLKCNQTHGNIFRFRKLAFPENT